MLRVLQLLLDELLELRVGHVYRARDVAVDQLAPGAKVEYETLLLRLVVQNEVAREDRLHGLLVQFRLSLLLARRRLERNHYLLLGGFSVSQEAIRTGEENGAVARNASADEFFNTIATDC